MYWLMVFIISVILLNLLIAQFNKTYEMETDDAETLIAMIRLEISQKLETASWRKFAEKLRVTPIQWVKRPTYTACITSNIFVNW